MFRHTSMHPRIRRLLPVITVSAALITALGVSAPTAGAAGPVERSLNALQKRHEISKSRARWALRTYMKARQLSNKLNKPIRGKSDAARAKRAKYKVRRGPMKAQIKIVSAMARDHRISGDRMAPLFTTLSNNTRWFRHNGPAAVATDRRFGNSRIIFQYFAGIGWQFHPLSNFAKLNAIWTVDTPPSRRAQRSFARELIHWGVNRNGALTWEYYFNFQGSAAPWISAISQGTAMQSLARVAYRMHNRSIMRAAKRAGRSFSQPPPRGVRVRRDGGYHFLGYSGRPKLIILNMFLQSLIGIRTYYVLADDAHMRSVYRKGLAAAIQETPEFDTGSWSLYSLNGEKTDMNYHLLTIDFLDTLCKVSKQQVFCDTRDKFKSYLK
ncbi:MAG: D-glucuronyl C5-epimerase family protein [Solirubrobacterales bacterium]